MVQLGQAVELTIIGMSVVFIVLLLLTFLLKLMGKFFGVEEKKVDKKSKTSVESEGKKAPVSYKKKTSSSNPKMAAAIAAALTMYNEEKNNNK